jgi:hypothetical protein
VQEVLPLPYKDPSAEAVNAIAYATMYHRDWFWRGALSRQAACAQVGRGDCSSVHY